MIAPTVEVSITSVGSSINNQFVALGGFAREMKLLGIRMGKIMSLCAGEGLSPL